MAIKVLVADDHKIVRDGLCALLAAEDDMEVVGQAEEGREAVTLARRLEPDVVIMDVGMPDLNGMEAARQVIDNVPDVRVIALSMHSDRRFIEGMLRAGASGYLVKDIAYEELVQAVRTVAGGRTYLCSTVTDVVVDDYANLGTQEQSPIDLLTPREREVLQLLAEGKATKQIAFELDISVKTVETYRSRLMDKLKLRSVPELTKYAIREGLTFLEG